VPTIIQEVAVEEFDLSLAEMRIINPEWVVRIQNSMWLHGQLQPLVVRPNDGKYQVIDGIKRVHAAIELMMETLQCYVLDVDLKQAKLLVLSYNRPHQSMEVWEEAMVLDDLSKKHNLTQLSLSRLTGYSRSWVSRRLSLVGKIDEQIIPEIKMGVLNSSHARALLKLPRGNQVEVARVITSRGLTSRQSNALVDAFLAAKNQKKQRHILDNPEQVLNDREPVVSYDVCDTYDPRLSQYGNDLMNSIQYVLSTIKHMHWCLHQGRFGTLKETEEIIITPEIKKVQGHAENLIKSITHLQINKQVNQNER
jgi:ParB family transcriptional regulator, chromosome partitioning protein